MIADTVGSKSKAADGTGSTGQDTKAEQQNKGEHGAGSKKTAEDQAGEDIAMILGEGIRLICGALAEKVGPH